MAATDISLAQRGQATVQIFQRRRIISFGVLLAVLAYLTYVFFAFNVPGLMERLRIPQRLWQLSPTTFSGGEQQRVNIARGFVHPYPALLLDEPTASLDPVNRETVLCLIEEAKARGAAIVGIFHDAPARARVADREIDVGRFTPGWAA